MTAAFASLDRALSDLVAAYGGARPIEQGEGDSFVIAFGRVASPIRTGNSSASCAATAASTADLGEANAAHTPSPVCLNNQPPCDSIAWRSCWSWAAMAVRIESASASQRRVDPSTSVNRKVTIPEGGPPGSADTPAGCHSKRIFVSNWSRCR